MVMVVSPSLNYSAHLTQAVNGHGNGQRLQKQWRMIVLINTTPWIPARGVRKERAIGMWERASIYTFQDHLARVLIYALGWVR